MKSFDRDEDASTAGTATRNTDAVLPGDLVRALSWLHHHLDEPVQLDTLAQIAGVRPRTLEAHFRQFLATTPLGWVRQARLARARRRFLAASANETVTSIALESGFGQLGRFAGQYSLHYGESPSKTLRRAKTARGGDNDVDDEALRLTWLALPAAFTVAAAECNVALESLARAQELAPHYCLPKALAAWCYGQRAAQHFGSTTNEDRILASQLAEDALKLAPDDSMVLTLCSGAFVLAHRTDEADRLIERALAIDPWSPLAHSRLCWLSVYQGDIAGALRGFRRLMPYESVRHTAFIGIGCAHFAAGRYDRAAIWAKNGVEASPGSFWGERIVVAATAHAGARAEAHRAAQNLRRKDPELTLEVAMNAWPFPREFMTRLTDGLAIAGLPRE
jgi:AraC-like DNA-binding protein